MKRKLVSLFMVGAMAAGLLAGCGSASDNNGAANSAANEATDAKADASDTKLDGSWPAETVKIGVEVYDTTDTTVIAYMDYFKDLEDYYNVEFMFSESISNAEDELAFAESCASAGCVGYIGGYNCSGETIVDKSYREQDVLLGLRAWSG